MNTIWSKNIQGANTLYFSRKLRFDDLFSNQYLSFFGIKADDKIKILEIGCGPGALAGALRRWYPNAEITGIDRDSEFIRFAKKTEPNITFIEGDATKLPFTDNSFDVVISNTVSEHINPTSFYSEQYRVLKKNGVCLVLSSRKGINIRSDILTENDFEHTFWEKASKLDCSLEEFSVGQYAMNEAELPTTMESFGFREIKTGYAIVDLTPDDPKFTPQKAIEIIDSNRVNDLDTIESIAYKFPKNFSDNEIYTMKSRVNAKYDARIFDYQNGKKHWDTNTSIIMMIRGIK